ncbi:Hsp20/alpha crystallin family protein [Neobacillus dielmonensis]|uniref:Hsp20/alpha crystallin family protein n=1 Tax=Neobacillus dielmonensis TaxID=1347369 RepID=UPI0005A8624C|nr:Hsp20/alpha crystallin family protein [Neobacillus dielmonensis]
MELEKYKKWMEAAQQFQSESFWNKIFDSPNLKNPPLTPIKMSELIPKCDLYESEEYLIAEIELPGVPKESLHISVQRQLLVITGEFKTLKVNHKYHLKERPNHQFKKELTLPYPIDVKDVKSELRNGVLFIVMPFTMDDMETIPIELNDSAAE